MKEILITVNCKVSPDGVQVIEYSASPDPQTVTDYAAGIICDAGWGRATTNDDGTEPGTGVPFSTSRDGAPDGREPESAAGAAVTEDLVATEAPAVDKTPRTRKERKKA